MDTLEISNARARVESAMNGNIVKERPLPDQETSQLLRRPRVLVPDQGGRSSGAPSSAPPRLLPIEGLRAYLALWVLAANALWASGYHAGDLAGLPKLLRMGPYAADLFIIVSGFVIVLLLDQQRETYRQFIARRFFRLFPVFITLFVVAIPLSQMDLWNLTHVSQYLTPDLIERRTAHVMGWWKDIEWNILLHMLMLHGAVPEGLLPEGLLNDAPGAFLWPAWSVSLEWQFYLVAPLAYAWAVSAKSYRRFALCGLCLVVVWAAQSVFQSVQYRAALPFHVEYFFLGAVSYFIYKRRAAPRLSDTAFPVACCLAVFLYWLNGSTWGFIPVGFWMVFMGLLLEHPASYSSRLVSPLLTNPVVLYLGRISYSMCLSHILVITVTQYVLLTWAPDLSQMAHLGVLLTLTTGATIAVSAVLYRYIEVPGIYAGRYLAGRLAAQQAVGPQGAVSLPRETEPNPFRSHHPAL